MLISTLWVCPHAYRGMIWVTLEHRRGRGVDQIMFTRLAELWMKVAS